MKDSDNATTLMVWKHILKIIHVFTDLVSDPCFENPCSQNSYCQKSNLKRDYDCVCDEGFSPAEIGSKLGGCYKVCNQTGQLLLHAEEKNYTKCMDGTLLCLVEGNTYNHGESLNMLDGIMKLPLCES